MELEPELAAQLKRVLSSLETLLPRPVPRIDWSECVAANWRKRSFSGFLVPPVLPTAGVPQRREARIGAGGSGGVAAGGGAVR